MRIAWLGKKRADLAGAVSFARHICFFLELLMHGQRGAVVFYVSSFAVVCDSVRLAAQNESLAKYLSC